MLQPTAAVAVAAVCVLINGCATTKGNAETTTSAPPTTPNLLVERELTGLLLGPEEVNAAMGTTGMTVTSRQTSMADNRTTVAPQECLAIDGVAEAMVYADSGYRAEADHSLSNGGEFPHYLKQAVVMFPTAEMAGAFFDASAQKWPACREYTHTQTTSQWSVGQIFNADRTLSTTTSQQNAGGPGWRCGRALLHRDYAIIDIGTCSTDPGDSALRIAHQVAANVTTQW